MTDRFLIAGLGNPGRDYEKTRHNIGFQVIDSLAAAHAISLNKVQSRAMIGDGTIAGQRVLLVKPMTYMNLSGEAVGSLLNFYKLPVANLITLSDDMDIPLGTLRLRKVGSAGGQNGLKNIISHLGTDAFARIRVGIGRPPGKMQAAAYVLQAFDPVETVIVDEAVRRAIKAIECWLTEGIDNAMNQFNVTEPKPAPAPKPPRPAKPPLTIAAATAPEPSADPIKPER